MAAHTQGLIPCVSPIVQDLEEVLSKDVGPPHPVHESALKKAVGLQQGSFHHVAGDYSEAGLSTDPAPGLPPQPGAYRSEAYALASGTNSKNWTAQQAPDAQATTGSTTHVCSVALQSPAVGPGGLDAAAFTSHLATGCSSGWCECGAGGGLNPAWPMMQKARIKSAKRPDLQRIWRWVLAFLSWCCCSRKTETHSWKACYAGQSALFKPDLSPVGDQYTAFQGPGIQLWGAGSAVLPHFPRLAVADRAVLAHLSRWPSSPPNTSSKPKWRVVASSRAVLPGRSLPSISSSASATPRSCAIAACTCSGLREHAEATSRSRLAVLSAHTAPCRYPWGVVLLCRSCVRGQCRSTAHCVRKDWLYQMGKPRSGAGPLP